MQSVSAQELTLVISLLDQYLKQKQLNILLQSWKSLKSQKQKQVYNLKTSLAEPLRKRVVKAINCLGYEKGQRQNERPLQQPGRGMKKINLQDDSFEDMILEKLQKLQKSVHEAKSRSNSIRSCLSRQRSLNSSEVSQNRPKFTQNPKYILLRENLSKISSAYDKQNTQHHSNSFNKPASTKLQNRRPIQIQNIDQQPEIEVYEKGFSSNLNRCHETSSSAKNLNEYRKAFCELYNQNADSLRGSGVSYGRNDDISMLRKRLKSMENILQV